MPHPLPSPRLGAFLTVCLSACFSVYLSVCLYACLSLQDIANSEMAYMGYKDSESYGLTWKVRTCVTYFVGCLLSALVQSSGPTLMRSTFSA